MQAVDDLSFEVAAGRVTGFLGPNGSGKTTTLRMLLGLVSITQGTRHLRRTSLSATSTSPIRHVGAVLEATSFHPCAAGRGPPEDGGHRRRDLPLASG